MAIIHQKAGSTKYLLDKFPVINGLKLESLEDIRNFQDHYTEILSDIEKRSIAQVEEEISRLDIDECELSKKIELTIEDKTREIDLKINDLKLRYNNAQFLEKIKYRIIVWIELTTKSNKIYDSSKELKIKLKLKKERKEYLTSNKYNIVKSECNKLEYTYKIISDEKSFVVGALGEEEVIEALSLLPDVYHVINDVRLNFPGYIHWREFDEYIKTSQIDHIVIGPTGLFLLETKKMPASDLESNKGKIIHQIRRSSFALWHYLSIEHFKEKVNIRSTIVSIHGNYRWQKFGEFVDIVMPYQLNEYILKRKIIFSQNKINELVNILTK